MHKAAVGISLSLLILSIASQATAACRDGPSGDAYKLGHVLAFQGVPTSPAAEVAQGLTTCFEIGYREGRLQRLLRISQPNPPSLTAQRPRTAH